ncbi:MAG: hypothetical protein FJ096_11395 [Deltaproteobacteria bacterium]|nr:hypothetical protein [Deltaproteobacteria bacterium]
MRNAHSLLLALPFVVACSATAESRFKGGSSGNGAATGSGSGGPTSGGGGGTDFTGSGNGTTTSGGGEGCSEAATFVYVLSTANELYSFLPDQKLFKKIGTLGCNTTMQPNSMAIDRDATAWVNYVSNDGLFDNGGALYPVSTSDASCKGAPLPLPQGWFRLGMGFSTDGNGSDSETLYLTGTNGGLGLGSFDFGAKTVKPLGQFTGSLAGQNAELTGTGDGRLFGFFTTVPVEVAEIGKSNGAIVNQKPLPQVPTPAAWAFSFWGGDFYLYTSDGLFNSRVSRYRPSDGTVEANYMADVGFIIVGAGVSTCAPVEPPK